MDLSKLREPFPAPDVEWRIGQYGVKAGKVWARVLAYITNRAIQERLDTVCGPENWANEYRPGPAGGVLCGISIFTGERWVTKWDGAANTEVKDSGKLDDDTNIKGGLSASMKRAGAQWGIGRYLYLLDSNFATVGSSGMFWAEAVDKETGKKVQFYWTPPPLPAWALPGNHPATEPTIAELKASLIDLINGGYFEHSENVQSVMDKNNRALMEEALKVGNANKAAKGNK